MCNSCGQCVGNKRLSGLFVTKRSSHFCEAVLNSAASTHKLCFVYSDICTVIGHYFNLLVEYFYSQYTYLITKLTNYIKLFTIASERPV